MGLGPGTGSCPAATPGTHLWQTMSTGFLILLISFALVMTWVAGCPLAINPLG